MRNRFCGEEAREVVECEDGAEFSADSRDQHDGNEAAAAQRDNEESDQKQRVDLE